MRPFFSTVLSLELFSITPLMPWELLVATGSELVTNVTIMQLARSVIAKSGANKRGSDSLDRGLANAARGCTRWGRAPGWLLIPDTWKSSGDSGLPGFMAFHERTTCV